MMNESSEEEMALLARQKTIFTLENIKPYFPGRTLESFKGQRCHLTHKNKVSKYIDELRVSRAAGSRTQTPSPVATTNELVLPERELFAKLPTNIMPTRQDVKVSKATLKYCNGQRHLVYKYIY